MHLQTCPPASRVLQVYYNGARLPVRDFQSYVDMYLGPRDSGALRVYERFGDRWEVCVSATDGMFQQVRVRWERAAGLCGEMTAAGSRWEQRRAAAHGEPSTLQGPQLPCALDRGSQREKRNAMLH